MQTMTECNPHETVLAQLNGAKVAAPLMNAVLATHGATDDTTFSKTTTKLGEALKEIVDDVLNVVAPNQSGAALNASTAVALSPLLADAWKLNPNQDSQSTEETSPGL